MIIKKNYEGGVTVKITNPEVIPMAEKRVRELAIKIINENRKS